MKKCDKCNGTGKIVDPATSDEPKLCPKCNGSGMLQADGSGPEPGQGGGGTGT